MSATGRTTRKCSRSPAASFDERMAPSLRHFSNACTSAACFRGGAPAGLNPDLYAYRSPLDLTNLRLWKLGCTGTGYIASAVLGRILPICRYIKPPGKAPPGFMGGLTRAEWNWQVIAGSYGSFAVALAATVGLSLIGVVLWGTVFGALLPFVLRAVRLDPASASAPFVATMVDVSGLVIYFTVARFILSGILL